MKAVGFVYAVVLTFFWSTKLVCEIDALDEPNVSCVVFMLENDAYVMNCSWVEPKSAVPVTYRLNYNHRCSETAMFECPHAGRSSCAWKNNDRDRPNDSLMLTPGIRYCIQLFTNYSEPANKIKEISPRDIVKPSAVQVKFENVTSSSVVLRWNHAAKDFEFLYRVVYTENDCQRSSQVVSTTDLSVPLRNLKPFRMYNLSVDCIPIDKENRRPRGIWSEVSHLTLSTMEDVPSQLPATTAGAFSSERWNEGSKRVTVYWQPLSPCASGGDILGYDIFYNISSKDSYVFEAFSLFSWRYKSVERNKISAVLMLNSAVDYYIVVHARTSSGLNASLTPVPILVLHDADIALKDKTSFLVISNSSILYASWKPVVNAFQYTFYWCTAVSADVVDCKDAINWMHVPASNSSLSVNFNSPQRMSFAPSVEIQTATGNLSSSGMIWSRCVYDVNADVKRPFSVQLHNAQATSLHVVWSEPPCRPEPSGYISVYVIEFCRVEEEECSDVEQVFVNSSATDFVLHNLVPSSTYRVRIMSSSLYSNSTFTDFINGSTTAVSVSMYRTFVIAIVIVTVVVAMVVLVIKLYMRKPLKFVIPDRPTAVTQRVTDDEHHSLAETSDVSPFYCNNFASLR